MSQLPAEVQTALGRLLAALSSADNNVRSQAEEHLTNDWVVNRPDVLLMGLVEQMHGSQDTTVRNINHAGHGRLNESLGSIIRGRSLPQAGVEVEKESSHERVQRPVLLPEQRSESRNKAATAAMSCHGTSQPCEEQDRRRHCRDRETIYRQRYVGGTAGNYVGRRC